MQVSHKASSSTFVPLLVSKRKIKQSEEKKHPKTFYIKKQPPSNHVWEHYLTFLPSAKRF